MPKLFALLLLATLQSAHAGVTATLSLASADTLSIRYDIPASCQALTFVNGGIRPQDAQAMRANWRASDDCASIDGKGMQRSGATCEALQFTVPASTLQLDRVYPWAFPMGGAIYSHTSAFEVDTSCGPVTWKFSAPKGTVVLNGAAYPDNVSAASAQWLPVIFMERPHTGRSYVDARLSKPTSAFVSDTVQRTFDLYGRLLPGLDVDSAFVAITLSQDPRSFGGDVAAHSTIRLSVPASLPAPMEMDIHGYLAHEVAHMHQPMKWNDSWRDQPMIDEGGADLLRWIALAQLAWADQAYLKQYMDTAFNGCLIAAQGNSWNATAERGWGKAPYQCGLAFHAIGLAARSAQAPATTVLRDYYRAGRSGAATDFASALECGAKAGCHARWLNRIAGAEPVAAVFSDYARSGGFLKVADTASTTVLEPVMRDVIGQLMRIDCHGQVSFYDNPGMLLIGPVGQCAVLREGMSIVTAQGQPLYAGVAVIASVLDACAGKGAVSLGLKDGTAIELGCSAASVRAPAELFEVDVARLRTLLGV
ncbi:MAG: hypothetical protein V4484_14445 [Pseudomonadota bacterium]